MPGCGAAADEVNDFQPIAVFELGFEPTIAGNNVAIQFHGHAIRLHAEEFYECSQGEGSGGKVTLFSIDVKFHKAETLLDDNILAPLRG